jgi:hypothetical protein
MRVFYDTEEKGMTRKKTARYVKSVLATTGKYEGKELSIRVLSEGTRYRYSLTFPDKYQGTSSEFYYEDELDGVVSDFLDFEYVKEL